MRRRLLLLATAAALAPISALAEGVALVMGTGNYEELPDLARGAEAAEAVDGLARLGFSVAALEDARTEEVAGALATFATQAPAADRLLVVLSGRFVTDGQRTWYLTRDAGEPRLFGLGVRAVSVESVLQVMAARPSHAVLLLGVDPAQDETFDRWLHEGVGNVQIPQGVTLLRGTPRDAANFLADELSVAGADLTRLVDASRSIEGAGYLPRGFVFNPAAQATRPGGTQADQAQENALWQGAVALNTVQAYQNYLDVYPRGRYATQARQGIEAILSEPNREARLAEEALRLSADQRREIQRNLALLEFDPRGIDGIFGPGTRSAITDWQQQNGFSQTSYLDREQIERLSGQAARRAQQLEAEAQRQQQAAERADRAYWEETGARGDEAGLRAYVARYPDGLFAQDANDQLQRIEDTKRAQAQGQDRTAWDAARRANTIASYQRYLETFPQGRFVEEARSRRNELVQAGQEAEATAQARAGEQALGLNPATSRVIEQRLDALGLEPGPVDGRFDRATRRALRNYQRDRGLEVTGFLNEATLVRLLADTLGRQLQE